MVATLVLVGERGAGIAQLGEFVAQGAWTDTELFSRFLAAALEVTQGFNNDLGFSIAQILVQLPVILEQWFERNLFDATLQHDVLWQDFLALLQDQGPLYHIVEFTHVTRPIVLA